MNHLDILKKISYGISLSADEARYALSYIGDIDDVLDSDGSRGFYLLALTFGLMAKGLTHEELYGLTLSLYDKSIQFQEINIDLNRSIDISGTGGDIIKTLNVSTTASIILAACGVTVPKQATRSYTSTCGSADLFLELGIDLFNNYDINNIKYSLEKVGVALFYSPMYSPCHKNRVNFLNFLKKINLSYSIVHQKK